MGLGGVVMERVYQKAGYGVIRAKLRAERGDVCVLYKFAYE